MQHTGKALIWTLVVVLVLGVCCSRGTRAPIEITGVRFPTKDEPQFDIEDARGLIVSVRINELKGKPKLRDFRLLFSDGVSVGPIALGAPDAADRNQRWTVLKPGIEGTIEKEGRYEFVYIIGPTTKEASLQYGDERIGSFSVPW